MRHTVKDSTGEVLQGEPEARALARLRLGLLRDEGVRI